MRRSALLGLIVLLGGCQFAGNPLSGFGGFLYDTHAFQSNPNLPPGSDETMQRVEGHDIDVAPLQPEPGDVWPGPIKPIPTMEQLQRENNLQEQLPPPNVPNTTPPALFPNEPTVPQASTTPNDPTVGGVGGSGVRSITGPGGQQTIMVPNGNGTSTLIGPDGSIQTVPTPK